MDRKIERVENNLRKSIISIEKSRIISKPNKNIESKDYQLIAKKLEWSSMLKVLKNWSQQKILQRSITCFMEREVKIPQRKKNSLPLIRKVQTKEKKV